MGRHLVITLLAVLALAPRSAAAAGAWTTQLRAFTFTDVTVRGDTVWCATVEGGLVRYVASTGTFDRYVREPGALASNSLNTVTFDRSGRLWIGTRGRGASRLDPDGRWALVNAFDGLPADTVGVIEADGDTLWLGTPRGLALWNGREIVGVLPDGSGPSPFESNQITGIALIGDTVWVATARGAYRARRSVGLATWAQVSAGLPVSHAIDALASDGTDLLALSEVGVYRRDPALDQWVLAGDIGVVRRLSDDAGRIFASSSTGIHRWTGAGWTLVDALVSGGQAQDQYAAGAAADGTTWVANQNGLRLLPGGAALFPGGPPGNNVLNVEVQGGRVYVNTLSEGVGRFDGASWKYWFPGGVMRSDTTFRDPRFVFALIADRAGRKWFGQWAPLRSSFPCEPDTGLIEVLDDSGSPPDFTHILGSDGLEPSRHSFARSATLDSAYGVWFGFGSPCPEDPAFTPIAIDHYDSSGAFVANHRPANTTPPMSGSEVRALTVDSNGGIWVGYKGQGIDWFQGPVHGQTWSGPTPALVPNTGTYDVRGLAAYGDSVWVYTTSELRRYDRDNKSTVATYVVPAGPSESATRPIDVAADGTVWLGSLNGVRVYYPDRNAETFTSSNSPLADDEVRAIRVDRATGVVWIATARGLSAFDPGYAPPVPTVPRVEVHTYPNPAKLSGLGVRLRIAGNVDRFTGEVLDVTGRVLRRFESGSGEVFWDGRDDSGQIVRPGLYFVRVNVAGRDGVTRFILLR